MENLVMCTVYLSSCMEGDESDILRMEYTEYFQSVEPSGARLPI